MSAQLPRNCNHVVLTVLHNCRLQQRSCSSRRQVPATRSRRLKLTCDASVVWRQLVSTCSGLVTPKELSGAVAGLLAYWTCSSSTPALHNGSNTIDPRSIVFWCFKGSAAAASSVAWTHIMQPCIPQPPLPACHLSSSSSRAQLGSCRCTPFAISSTSKR